MSTAEQLYELFAGSDLSHGTYTQEDQPVDGSPKREIKRTARTIREPATIDHWSMHLKGIRPLGIVPIGPGDCCKWATIDIDQYNGNMDHGELAKKLEETKVPGIVCKSKSGGAHVYLFFKVPLPAALIIAKAKQLAVMIGHSGSEIFPKQATIDRTKDFLGNWINMPYFNAASPVRYGVKANGNGMTVEEFISLAFKSQITAEQLGSFKLRHQSEEFSDGPPCLESLITTGFPDNTRNEGLFDLTTLAKKMRPNGDWRGLVHEWNTKYVGLKSEEVEGVIKSSRKKDYNYKCTKDPIKSVCNSMLCRTRQYGVGDGNQQDVSLLETIIVYETDPPIFLVGLQLSSGKHVTVKVPADRLKSPDLFQTSVLNQHHHLIPTFRNNPWEKRIASLLEEAQHITAPKEAGERGQFFEILTTFVTDRYSVEEREGIFEGKCWKNTDDGYYYFRLQDLHKMLDQNKFSPSGGRTRAWMASELRDLGGTDKGIRVKGRHSPVSVFRISCDLFEAAATLSLPNVDESPL